MSGPSQPAQFDSYADDYQEAVGRSIEWSGQDVESFARRKADEVVDLARRRLGDPGRLRVLDVGCGVGVTDRYLSAFGELHGVDTASEPIARAAEANPAVRYSAYDGTRLPYDASHFDLAFAICVVHHVQPADRPAFYAELARVVRPGGLVAIFEHNPLNPLTRLAVSRCEFDEDAVLVTRTESAALLRGAGLEPLERRYIVFMPFEPRRTRVVERALRWLPAGAQHYVAARRAG